MKGEVVWVSFSFKGTSPQNERGANKDVFCHLRLRPVVIHMHFCGKQAVVLVKRFGFRACGTEHGL